MKRHDPLRATRYVIARCNNQLVNSPGSEEEMANLASISELWHSSLKEYSEHVSQQTNALKEIILGWESEMKTLQEQVLTINGKLEYNQYRIYELSDRIKKLEEEVFSIGPKTEDELPSIPYWKRLLGYLFVGFVACISTVLIFWLKDK